MISPNIPLTTAECVEIQYFRKRQNQSMTRGILSTSTGAHGKVSEDDLCTGSMTHFSSLPGGAGPDYGHLSPGVLAYRESDSP